MNQGKPAAVQNPYAKASSSLKNPYANKTSSAAKRVPLAPSLHHRTVKPLPVVPPERVPPKEAEPPPKSMPPMAVIQPTPAPPTDPLRPANTERNVATADVSKKNPPTSSLKVKLKKEIEHLKKQQQRQKERLEAERHRRKLEKQAAARRKALEQQPTVALPTPSTKSAGTNTHVTPSPYSESGAKQSSASHHAEIVSIQNPPFTPCVDPTSSLITSSWCTDNPHSVVPSQNDSRVHHGTDGMLPNNSQQSSNPMANSSSHVTTPLTPTEVLEAPPPMAPTAWHPHEPLHKTQLMAMQPLLPSEGMATTICHNSVPPNEHHSFPPVVRAVPSNHSEMVANPLVQPWQMLGSDSQHSPPNENPIPSINELPSVAPMWNTASMMAPSNWHAKVTVNPFAQPSPPMMIPAVAFPHPYSFPVVSQDTFHPNMPGMMPTWEQAMYNLQQQQYYCRNVPATVGHFPDTMNPWVMTMAAASMGQALPQAQSVRRSAHRSSLSSNPKKTQRPSQQDWRLISSPCRTPSPFARTHEILPHNIVMVKHSNEHKGFGVTLKKVAECALVGFDEWPMEELVASRKPEQKTEQHPIPMGASISGAEKAEEIRVEGTPVEKQIQASPNTSDITEAVNNEMISPETTETANMPSERVQTVLEPSPSVAVENTMNDVAPEASKSIENNQSAASECSSSLPPTASEVKVVIRVAETTEKSEMTIDKQERQPKRRRRLFFCVMEVLNAAEQNKRSHSSKDPNMQLEEGDIILTIQGEETGRKSFDDAVKLFASVTSVGEDGFIQCVVTVARLKKAAPPLVRLPKSIPFITKNGASVPLTEPEFRALANAMIEVARNQHRILGQSITSLLMNESCQSCPLLSSRTTEFLVSTWEFITERLKREMRRRATEHWAAKWQIESVEIKASTKSPMSDAQRSSRRARPRPARGCRCGSQEHEYVNDANCPLYSNLRRLKQDISPEGVDPKATRPKIKGPKDLNVVEKAFKERFIRMKEEEVALEAEATFVGEMESIQMKQCGMAIFAPGSLAAMVLSAAVELEPMFRGRQAAQPVTPKELEVTEKDGTGDSDDDDDDDVPLTSLGKRSPGDASLAQNKKKKAEPQIPLDYFISLIRYICSRWGHVYREPSELDYAWRWEVYHGQFSLADSSNVCKNPRRAGALSLEHISFLIDTALVNELQQSDALLTNLPLDKLNTIAFAVLPSATGIVDEVYALLRSSILALNEAGIPKLAPQWSSNVDVLLLDDMDSYWGIRADPTGKFGMSQQIRATLHREWEKTDEGWILVVEDPYDVVYEFAVFDEWRDAFEDKEKTKADSIEGVGRFGI